MLSMSGRNTTISLSGFALLTLDSMQIMAQFFQSFGSDVETHACLRYSVEIATFSVLAYSQLYRNQAETAAIFIMHLYPLVQDQYAEV